MRLLLLVLSLVAGPALALVHDELLEPEKAFRISARSLDARKVEVAFRIACGYYMYRDRFSFATESGRKLAEAEIPRGKLNEDPFFGKSETFRDLVRIRHAEAAAGRVTLKVTSQGFDKGVCYVPPKQVLIVRLPRAD